ncbi:MAG: phage holin family protein [Thermoleophilia bacterium]
MNLDELKGWWFLGLLVLIAAVIGGGWLWIEHGDTIKVLLVMAMVGAGIYLGRGLLPEKKPPPRPLTLEDVQNDLDALRDYVEDELSKIKQSVNQNEWRTDEQLASLNWRLNSVETDLEDLKPE